MFLPLFYCNKRVSLKKNIDKQTSLINKIKIELRDSFEAFAFRRITKTEYIEYKNKKDVILADAEKKLERYELKMQEKEAQEETVNGILFSIADGI
ncbi:hypothetical protein SAMN05660484_01129 [Eubacterium ruminantium]|uniref:Uncharacterized protein n=1 Tax=Eubacterium ruminantium TaxID=42322 RepID=A0A1T4MAK4_9FIRM|nr:hypothetical protein [Eubacterium ruminantium]SCW46644.1 hypothetical protein SAMN05660484_01129 [Eubacterium ruminantium]SDM53064.1 hypothetical protein SAMN04490370_1041 [Eubacterium ruminantium]SJZ63945.1 hypothetical protein SAMN02745110_01130 [Eubacterium ruminantium]